MHELTLTATIDNISEATAFVDAQLEELGCPMKAQMQLDIAVDELFGNIARYAYAPETGEATLRFEYDEAEKAVRLTFIDRGVYYDPLKKEDPDVTLSSQEREVGGLGIFLVKKTMDGMFYERRDGQNILTVVKKIGV